jgi:dCMP deaminase
MDKWDLRFLELVDLVSTWSKDRSTQVGAVIVEPKSRVILSTGYNGMARGIDDDIEGRHVRPEKYLWTEHAERNAIFHAARHGIKLEGATMYLRWTPCSDCARAIIQAGLARVVCAPVSEDTPEHWRHSFETALDMLHEAGVELYDNR